jgi:hypothetical protein
MRGLLLLRRDTQDRNLPGAPAAASGDPVIPLPEWMTERHDDVASCVQSQVCPSGRPRRCVAPVRPGVRTRTSTERRHIMGSIVTVVVVVLIVLFVLGYFGRGRIRG